MRPNRAPTRALKLSRGLFGAGKAKAVPANDPDRRETSEAEEPPGGPAHLFGR